MITRAQMFEPMLAACPSFVAAWAAFCAEWGNEPAKAPLYLVLGKLADHLVEQLQAGTTEDFPAVFGVVERWHCEGEHYVREAATVGLLEDLQNLMGRKGVNRSAYDGWLMPESKRWWDKLHRCWAGDTGALGTDSYRGGSDGVKSIWAWENWTRIRDRFGAK